VGKYLDIARRFGVRQQGEERLLALQAEAGQQQQEAPALPSGGGHQRPPLEEPEATEGSTSTPWLCPYCGQSATIEDVFPSLDEERMLTMWRCDPCQVVAVTPDAIRQPPAWVPGTLQ